MDPTKSKLLEHIEYMQEFVDNFEEYLRLGEGYQELVAKAKEAWGSAQTYRTALGSAVQTVDGQFFTGFNIENTSRSWDDHAEKIATVNAMIHGYEKENLVALAVVCKAGAYTGYSCPACGYCLQYLWENTNPELLLIDADTDGKINLVMPLKLAYPLPWPERFPERLKLQ